MKWYDLSNSSDVNRHFCSADEDVKNYIFDYIAGKVNNNFFFSKNRDAVVIDSIDKVFRVGVSSKDSFVNDFYHSAYTCSLTNLQLKTNLVGDVGFAFAGESVLLAFIDLDNFKALNDSKGHDFGDLFLKKFGEAIFALELPRYQGYRYGGDEFIIIAADCHVDEFCVQLSRLISSISAFNSEQSLQGYLGCSIGVAQGVISDAATVDFLISAADAEMYSVKRRGKNGISVAGNAAADLAVADLLSIGDLCFYKQKCFKHNGQLHHVEYLSYLMADGNRYGFNELYSMDGFASISNQYHLKLIALIAADAVNSNVKISINLSTSQVICDDFLTAAVKIFEDYGICHSRVIFEIPSFVVQKEFLNFKDFSTKCVNMGFGLCVDRINGDFTNYLKLHGLEVKLAKLDADFCLELCNAGSSSQILLSALIGAFTSVGIETCYIGSKRTVDVIMKFTSGLAFYQLDC